MQRTMYDSGYQGDRHTLPRPGMVTSLHDTSSPTSLVQLASADRVEAGNANPLYGGVLRCPKPRATQDKRSEQEHFVFNNELVQKLKRRNTINGEESGVQLKRMPNKVQENTNTVTASQVMAADNITTRQPTGANPNRSRTTRRPAPPILPKPRKRNNSDHIPVQELHDAHQGLEELSLTHTEHRHREGQMTIQAAGSETPTDAIPKTSAVHRPPITPPPKKRNSVKIKDQTTKDAQVSLTDTEHLLHDEGQMTIQDVCSPKMETPQLQQSTVCSAIYKPAIRPRPRRSISCDSESDKKGENNKERSKSLLLCGNKEVERQPSYGPESSEIQSTTQPYANILSLQKIVTMTTQAEQANLCHNSTFPQESLYKATRQAITDAGNDESTTTGRQANQASSELQFVGHKQDFSEATKQPINAKKDWSTAAGTRANQFDVTVKQLAPLQKEREREAAHQQELEEMKQLYMNKRIILEDKYKGMIDEFKEWHEERMSDLKKTHQNEHNELRRQLTDEFHTTLAVQSAELDATHAENARLLTTADQTLLDHQKQLVELQQELAPKVKQYEADIQQLITDNEANLQRQKDETKAATACLLTALDQAKMMDHRKQLLELQQEKEEKEELAHKIKQYEAYIQQLLADNEDNLQRQKDENQWAIQQLEASLENYQNENHKLSAINQELEVSLQQCREHTQQLEDKLHNQDELSPYVLPQSPDLRECEGVGSYGSVHRIQLNGISCIAKRIHDILLGQGREEGVNLEDKRAAYIKFYCECVLLSRLRHPNIVQFMGVYYGPQRDYGRELTLVMERLYMNLEGCLKQYRNIAMWLKVSILLDITQGLLHLHSQGIVHRDLTAPNILLTTSFHAKIADLGVSKIINVHPLAASKQSMIPGTLGYMPPEALAEIPVYGYALDIFSFGVLTLFVLLQVYPQYYDNLVTPEGLTLKESHIQKRSKWIGMLSFDNPFLPLIRQCLQDVPARRPTTINLNSELIRIAETYPKPYQDIIDMLSH